MSSCPLYQAALRSLAFLLFLHVLALSGKAHAGSFSVNPVRVELSGQTKVAALSVHNTGEAPASIQLQLLQWIQQGGEELYSPTTELLATPPIFTLLPGESQVIRIGLRRPPDLDTELAYRLILQEIPPPSPDNFQGLRVALRLSLPVFVAPMEIKPQAALRWEARRLSSGGVALTAVNNGTAHGQVTQLSLRTGTQEQKRDINTYILPGSHHTWQWNPGDGLAQKAILELTAKVNGIEITERLPAE